MGAAIHGSGLRRADRLGHLDRGQAPRPRDDVDAHPKAGSGAVDREPSPPPDPAAITRLLDEASGGNVEALNRLLPLVYDELRGLARARLRGERPGHTLDTTALVHEAYIKLVDQTRVEWRGRAHFYGVASEAMRRILVNYAEARNAQKRGGDAVVVPLEDADLSMTDPEVEELLALDRALTRLREFNERGADVVVYRFFGGLTYDEIADVIGTSAVTARRAWTVAKSWLHRELRETVPGWSGSRLGANVNGPAP